MLTPRLAAVLQQPTNALTHLGSRDVSFSFEGFTFPSFKFLENLQIHFLKVTNFLEFTNFVTNFARPAGEPSGSSAADDQLTGGAADGASGGSRGGPRGAGRRHRRPVRSGSGGHQRRRRRGRGRRPWSRPGGPTPGGIGDCTRESVSTGV